MSEPIRKDIKCRGSGHEKSIRDSASGDPGNVRSIGRIAEAATLTTYDPNHPYYMAEYDLDDRG
jgi:hypothetical protein